MIFKKKKMVDVRDLQKKGLIAPENHEPPKTANREGFVDFTNEPETKKETPTQQTGVEAPGSVFGFMDTPTQTDNFSTEPNGYSKREVDAKIEQLDNKIYKMEQRIELLERKAGVQSGSSQPTGVGGLW